MAKAGFGDNDTPEFFSQWDDPGRSYRNDQLERDYFGNPLFKFEMGQKNQPDLSMPGDERERERQQPDYAGSPSGRQATLPTRRPMPPTPYQADALRPGDIPETEQTAPYHGRARRSVPDIAGDLGIPGFAGLEDNPYGYGAKTVGLAMSRPALGKAGARQHKAEPAQPAGPRPVFNPHWAGHTPTRSVMTPRYMGDPADAKPAGFMTLWKMAKVDDLASKISQDAIERFPGVPIEQAIENYGLLANGDLVYYDQKTKKIYPVGPRGIWGSALQFLAGVLGQASPIAGAVLGGSAGFLLGGPVGAVIGAGVGGGAGGWARKAEGSLVYDEPNTPSDYWYATLIEAYYAALGEGTLQMVKPVARAVAKGLPKISGRTAGLGGGVGGSIGRGFRGSSVAPNTTMPELLQGIPKSVLSDWRNLGQLEND